MTDREAMQNALEALTRIWEDGLENYPVWAHESAIDDLRERLAQPEQKPEPPPWWPAVENILNEYGLQAIDFVADFKEAMKQAEQERNFCPRCGKRTNDIHTCTPPQPEQKPVTLPCCGYADTSAVKWNKYSGVVQCHHCGHTYTPLARPEQEPIAWANKDDLQNFDMRVRTNSDPFHTVPLYTAPPRREWVPLTEEQIRKCFFRDDATPSSPPYWWEYRDPDYRVIYALIDKALRENNT